MTMRGFWLAADPLVLASGSKTRRLLLESAGIPVTARPATIDERAVEQPLVAAGAAPAEVALHLARAKALAVSLDHPEALVLGGDQTLALGARAFHKPEDLDAAATQLSALSGRTHALHSAAVLARGGTVLDDMVGTASLTMRALSPDFIARYLAVVGPDACDSVGGYKLEGFGIHLFDHIEGDQPTVLGLPLLLVLASLRRLGALAA